MKEHVPTILSNKETYDGFRVIGFFVTVHRSYHILSTMYNDILSYFNTPEFLFIHLMRNLQKKIIRQYLVICELLFTMKMFIK